MRENSLSERELGIARLVAKGWSNRRIAQRHRILEQSVKNSLSNVYRKLGIDNRVQLTLLVTAGRVHNGLRPRKRKR